MLNAKLSRANYTYLVRLLIYIMISKLQDKWEQCVPHATRTVNVYSGVLLDKTVTEENTHTTTRGRIVSPPETTQNQSICKHAREVSVVLTLP
jgi:hypothetical protein